MGKTGRNAKTKREIAGQIIEFLGQGEGYHDWLIQDGSPQAAGGGDGGEMSINPIHGAHKEMFPRHFHWPNITPVCFSPSCRA